MNHLQNFGQILTRDAMKQIVGGNASVIQPIGDGFSCECKDGYSAGMSSCDTCERYCSTDNAYGGQSACS